METENSTPRRPDHRLRPLNGDKGRFFTIRQWLNSIFIIGAIIGIFIYVFTNKQDLATYVILVSMALKIVETVLRMIK